MIQHNVENPILDNLDSDDPDRQAVALMDLVDAQFYPAAPHIVRLLKSPEADIRADAAYALGYLGVDEPQRYGVALMELLDDGEELVRCEAVEALGLLVYSPAVDNLKKLLREDSSPLVRASAAEALGQLGKSEALEVLEDSLRDADEDESVRAYAANAIGLLHYPPEAQILGKLKNYLAVECSLSVKSELLGAIYWLGTKAALSELLELLTNADENLATSILNILTDLAGRHSPSMLATDAGNMGEVLRAIAQRFPILAPHAQQLLIATGSQS
ncbi:MAG TPA: HEAT repeat domain-containing protein [Oscillatoriaceae cyanobacterium M33_DOE_052]|uniref:HEAT repeat domain-containing protein n=1 Tax=Planktothricoides sp. SpSt-374 TaxID=2282167 RepID=A0A7C3VPZ4_9CYAN|nr:HEAT repeat domain-containing protein [Oscillatoriaceae cyanobacterium M33_DOE_052]